MVPISFSLTRLSPAKQEAYSSDQDAKYSRQHIKFVIKRFIVPVSVGYLDLRDGMHGNISGIFNQDVHIIISNYSIQVCP